jgi:monovalent cation/hydrogen antiporter
LLTPFVAYLLAERYHMSGVLSVVTAGLFISWRSREVFSSETRLQTKVVWDTVIFLLNGIVFILIGLQMPAIVQDLKAYTIMSLVGYGLLVSLVTIGIRILWVFAGAYNRSLFSKKSNKADGTAEVEQTSWKNVLIVAWTGTRGVVSLATALALPLTMGDGTVFPKRHSILLLAFIVILVTLVVQGLTLPLLVKLLKIKPHSGLQKQEENDLHRTVAQNILHFIAHDFPIELSDRARSQVRKEYEMALNMFSESNTLSKHKKQESTSRLNYINEMLTTQLEIVKFQRHLLIGFHKEGTFNDETITKAERELDLEELRLTAMAEKGAVNELEPVQG